MADLQQVVDTVDKEIVAPDPAAAPAAPAEVDMDDAELASARAAVEKPDAQPAATATASPTAPAAPAAPVQPAEEALIPKARLDEVLAQNRAKDMKIAEQAGQIEGMKLAQPKAPGTPAPAAAPAESLTTVRNERFALAQKFDDGEISMSQLRKAEAELDDREHAIREQMLIAKIPAPSAPPGDLRLEERTQELEAAHPLIYAPEVQEEGHWNFLLDEATRQLQAAGVQFPNGPLPSELRFALRERVCILADTYGPIWGAKPTALATPVKPGAAPLSANAAARAAKLDAAAAAPPDINRLPQGPGAHEVTDAQIENMSEEEIAALPAGVRARFLT